MNDADKKKLIGEVAGLSTNWDLTFSDEGRRWFVDRVIRSLESATPATPDAGMPAAVVAVVTKAKEIVKTKVPIQLKIPIHESHTGWYAQAYPRRVEIIYGAIATDPGLAEPSNDKYLDLVIRRRFRAIARMDLWVNAGGDPPVFQYPNDECPGYSINVAARPLWNVATPHVSADGANKLPRWTIKTQGAGSVVPAVEQLWTDPPAACGGNVLECATAMSTVLMDSLVEAQNPNTLLRTLNLRGPLHLAICNPTLPDAGTTFIMDEDARRVFTTIHGSANDLQVGDYVYAWNHPLYYTFWPTGGWGGEHALIRACRSRELLTGFQVAGHGVPEPGEAPMTLAMLHAKLLKKLQTGLDLLYVAGTMFLAYMEAGVAAPEVQLQQRQETLPDGSQVLVHYYQFDRVIAHTNYLSDPISLSTYPRFVIVYTPASQKFGIHLELDLAAAMADPNNVLTAQLFRSVPPAQTYDPVNWAVAYLELYTGNKAYWPLFRRDNGRLTVNLLRERDMPDPPLARDPTKQGIRIVQPMHRPTVAGAV